MQSTVRFSKRISAALLGAFVLVSTVTAPVVYGKGGPTVTVDGPITIDGAVTIAEPVAIEGVVQVLNDTLYEPYVGYETTEGSVDSPTVYFDIPDGKRLIIEMIAYQASLPAGTSNRMFLQPLIGTNRPLIPLVIQDRVDAGGYYLVANIPFKMRIDSVEGSTQEIMIRRGVGGAGTLGATICGYLVDK